MTWLGQVVLEVNYFDEIIITASVFICLIFGTILSLPVVWNVLFPRQGKSLFILKLIKEIFYLIIGDYRYWDAKAYYHNSILESWGIWGD